MFEHKKIKQLNDYFTALGDRSEKCVYFGRINGYNSRIEDFIIRYYEAARAGGVVVEGKIPNPDEKKLAYYEEILGNSFQLDRRFILDSLKKWLPGMNESQRNSLSEAIFRCLLELKNSGKNDNMLKNSYIKFMCWLYYRFERVISRLGDNDAPKILYEGNISHYELMLISILSSAGCDVVLLQYDGDSSYKTLDPCQKYSDEIKLADTQPFPKGYCLKSVRESIQRKNSRQKLCGDSSAPLNCTNVWIKGKPFEDVLVPAVKRGTDEKLFYNSFFKITGVEDKITYLNELYRFRLELKNTKRKLLIIENKIPQPSADEVGYIKRKNYQNIDQLLTDMVVNLNFIANLEMQSIVRRAFVNILLEEAELPEQNMNKLVNKAIYLLCWLRRYYDDLFAGWTMPLVACAIYLGGCKNNNEALFMRFLSRLPVDVMVLLPNLNTTDCLKDKFLFEVEYDNSLEVAAFPTEDSNVRMATAAYHAERDLDSFLYTDSGMYRNYQYQQATSVTLQTMYEEIAILWNEELRVRPNFSTVDNLVTMPVIFAKVSGVKDGLVNDYWQSIRSLVTEDTIVVRNVPYINPLLQNPIKPYVAEFFKNGELCRDRIRTHQFYPYGLLREETQRYILDKLQLIIDRRIINGTFVRGVEYVIISTVLNMPKDVVRLIQSFDFTKKNPKVIYINTTEAPVSLEDAILMAYLNLIGFDVVYFVPTGYRSVECHYAKPILDEHNLGGYMYDLNAPAALTSFTDGSSKGKKPTWVNKLFKKGR